MAEPDAATEQVHVKTCPLCEAACGLRVTVVGEKVTLIRPNRDDVWSKGHICPKGTTLGHLHDDPDRLRAPLVRRGDRHVEVSWEEAFAECERLLRPVLDTDGRSAITAYIGNPTAHNYSLGRYVGALQMLAQFPMIYSAGTVDQWPKNVSSVLLYGNMWRIPVPDIARTDHIVVMGANPHASQGSLMGCPDVLGELDRIRERGGRVIVVDPRRTGTADHADEWIPIRPGTDAAFLLAIAQVLFAEGLVDVGPVASLVAGLDDVAAAARRFPPERVEAACGIPADTIRRVARDLASAPTSVVYGRIGLCNQEFGTLASWLVDVVNTLTGNLDRVGGLMFPKAINRSIAFLPKPARDTAEFGRWRSRVRGAPEVLGQVPVSCLAEEIATPGPGRIRALITVAGNPVISAPEADRLDAALPLLDCMISVDNWLNETTRHAHVILPGLSPLESPHYPEVLWHWAVRSAAKYSHALFPPEPGRPAEWEILLRLGGILSGIPNDEVDVAELDTRWFSILAAGFGADPGVALATSPEPGPDRITDLSIRMGPWGDRYGERPDGLTLDAVAAEPDGIDMGPMVPQLAEVLETHSGKVELAPPYILADLERLERRLDRQVPGLVLISRRHVRSNNSWMHNVKVLVKGKDRCTLLIHPDDATRCGVSDGGLARVSSEAGTLEVPVEVSGEMMPGVVSLPHGWGHDKAGTRLSVAREHAGVNNNVLAPGRFVDEISGNAAVNGIPVEVAPVA